jgi:hypothetical protein
VLYLLRKGSDIINVDSAEEHNRLNQEGWIDLTAAQIQNAGIQGYEAYVSPATANIDDNGVITFTPPTEAELRARREAEFNAAISARLNEFAAEKQYDDISAARLAALSSEYAADGQAAQAAYDATWTAAIAIWEQVASGAITVEQATAQLPALTWPV